MNEQIQMVVDALSKNKNLLTHMQLASLQYVTRMLRNNQEITKGMFDSLRTVLTQIETRRCRKF